MQLVKDLKIAHVSSAHFSGYLTALFANKWFNFSMSSSEILMAPTARMVNRCSKDPGWLEE